MTDRQILMGIAALMILFSLAALVGHDARQHELEMAKLKCAAPQPQEQPHDGL